MPRRIIDGQMMEPDWTAEETLILEPVANGITALQQGIETGEVPSVRLQLRMLVNPDSQIDHQFFYRDSDRLQRVEHGIAMLRELGNEADLDLADLRKRADEILSLCLGANDLPSENHTPTKPSNPISTAA